MTTLSDWKDRFARLNDSILQLDALVESSEKNTRGTDDLVKAVDELEKKKAILETKEKDYEQTAATFDREFLERKSEFSDPFEPDRFYTIQDFVFLFFFVSYSLLLVALALTVPSQQGKILLGGFIVLLIVFALIMRYA